MASHSPEGAVQADRPIRKRIKRACDKCSSSRTRCDGGLPCYQCQYDRKQKRRGRAPARASIGTTEGLAAASEHDVPPQRSEQSEATPTTTATLSKDNQNADDAVFVNPPTARPAPGLSQDPTSSRHRINGFRPDGYPPSLGFRDNLLSDDGPLNAFPPINQDAYNQPPFYPPSLTQSFLHLQPPTIASPITRPLFSDVTGGIYHVPQYQNLDISASEWNLHQNLVNPSLPSASSGGPTSSGSAIDFARPQSAYAQRNPGDRHLSGVEPARNSRPSDASVSTTSGSQATAAGLGCRYPVLRPLLPLLKPVVPAAVACDLLDLYFAELSSSLFHASSPYVLTSVLRRKSVLRASNPRETSPALLAAMLWVAAQTSDAQSFRTSPSARGTISDHLYRVCMAHLGPLARGKRKWAPETYRNASGAEIRVLRDSEKATSVGRDEIHAIGSLDDVLTFILLGIVVSGGDFKADCLLWMASANVLAVQLELNREENAENPDDSVDLLNTDTISDNNTSSKLERLLATEEGKEERRRTWWLLYGIDRHLALSFNAPLKLLDSQCRIYMPLDENTWQDLDSNLVTAKTAREYGPPMTMTGVGFFEYFLPLMTILGDIVELHHRSCHPRFGKLEDQAATLLVENSLDAYRQSLKDFENTNFLPDSNAGFNNTSPYSNDSNSRPVFSASDSGLQPLSPIEVKKKIVIAYSTKLLHVLHILLHGKWDPIAMLEDDDQWISTPGFLKCASHAISAADAVSEILRFDPDLSFMPYLFGIYLLHASFLLLLFVDKMDGGAKDTVGQACETIVRAHEICVVTLNTEYQRTFRKILLSALYNVRGIMSIDMIEHQAKRRELLSIYRWTKDGKGLAL